jgi:AraC-like DNA-binding protein
MKTSVTINTCLPAEKVIPADTRQLFLPLYLKHAAALILRGAGVFMCGLTDATAGYRLRRTPDFHFVIHTLGGLGQICVAGQEYSLKRRSVFLAPAGQEQIYFQTGKQNWSFVWFHMHSDAALLTPSPLTAQIGSHDSGRPLRDVMRGFAVEIFTALYANDSPTEQPPWGFYQDAMSLGESIRDFHFASDSARINADRIATLYAELILLHLERDLAVLRGRRVCDDLSARLDQLWCSVNADLSRQWSLQDMSALVNMSVSTLIRRVKDCYGSTPMLLLYHLRLKEAQRLLLTSNGSIGEIADAIGYQNLPSFTAAFRREYGLSPRAYRAQRLERESMQELDEDRGSGKEL